MSEIASEIVFFMVSKRNGQKKNESIYGLTSSEHCELRESVRLLREKEI